uniref:NADH dehydrogenase [ubiquinone] 1 beta subcomplex subunit 4 n=1 Tax=Sphenodon punctatus TaxID=8508 RepID=A0A8D0HM79_SPHPU
MKPPKADKYVPSPYATLPATLDPAEYDQSAEKRRASEERLAIRARLKREFQLKLNDPRRSTIIVSTHVRAHPLPSRLAGNTSVLGPAGHAPPPR